MSSAVVLPRLSRPAVSREESRRFREEPRRDPRTATGGSRLFAEFIWVAFVAAQAADGVFTYVGISLFGPGIEANPLIAFYVTVVGAGMAIAGAKAVAIGSALVLYTFGRHRTLGILTLWYLAVAIWPWSLVLFP